MKLILTNNKLTIQNFLKYKDILGALGVGVFILFLMIFFWNPINKPKEIFDYFSEKNCVVMIENIHSKIEKDYGILMGDKIFNPNKELMTKYKPLINNNKDCSFITKLKFKVELYYLNEINDYLAHNLNLKKIKRGAKTFQDNIPSLKSIEEAQAYYNEINFEKSFMIFMGLICFAAYLIFIFYYLGISTIMITLINIYQNINKEKIIEFLIENNHLTITEIIKNKQSGTTTNTIIYHNNINLISSFKIELEKHNIKKEKFIEYNFNLKIIENDSLNYVVDLSINTKTQEEGNILKNFLETNIILEKK